MSYDSLAAARWTRNAKTPPNAARIVSTPPITVGVAVVVVVVGAAAGVVGAELIIC